MLTSIDGLAIALGVFVMATLVGAALLTIIGSERKHRQLSVPFALLSPAAGYAAIILATTWLNILGLPIRIFATSLCAAAVVSAIAVLLRLRPRVPWRQLAPFAIVGAVAFILVGRPLFEYGTDWLSFSNDDMANYALEAQRQMDHGFMSIPNVVDWVYQKDASLYYWSSYVLANQRQGVDGFLGLIASIVHLNPLQAFMPVITGFQLMLVFSGCALVYGATVVRRRAAVIAAVFLSSSAMMALGAMAQLFAQVCGLGLLVAAAVAVAAALRHGVWRSIIVAIILSAATAVVYPEITPFLFLGCGLYAVRRLVQRKVPLSSVLWIGALMFLGIALLVNVAWRTYIYTLLPQITHGTNVVGQFWYFLVPSGPANLFGLLPVGAPPDTFGIDAYVIVGHALLALWVFIVARSVWRGDLAGCFAGVMCLIGLDLFVRRADFGLFKLAMFIQPFLLAVIAISVARLWTRVRRYRQTFARAAVVTTAFLFAACNIVIQQLYVERSRAVTSEFRVNSFAEVPYASPSRLLTEFASLHQFAQPRDTFVTDTMNFTVAKIEAAFTRPNPLVFLSQDFFFNISGIPETGYEIPRLKAIGEHLDAERSKMYIPKELTVTTLSGRRLVDKFVRDPRYDAVVTSPYAWLIEDSQRQTVLNRFDDDSRNLLRPAVVPLGGVRDHLVFVDSTLGRNYRQTLGPGDIPAGLFPPEPDNSFGRGYTMAGIGRYALFTILGPEQNIRVELSLTVTSKGNSVLPPVTIYGVGRGGFHLVGRGSARAISDPIVPLDIGGEHYLLLDMGANATSFPDRRKGLMTIYGRNIVIDRRHTSAFVRDISVLTTEQTQDMRAPSHISSFPKDLRDRGLEYSGIYEDGWFSEHSRVTLEKGNQRVIRYDGLVPMISGAPFSTKMTLRIDGRIVAVRDVDAGYFRLRFTVPKWVVPGRHVLQVSYDHGQELPHDGRLVGAQVRYLGFSP